MSSLETETQFKLPPQNFLSPVQSCAVVTRCADAWNNSFKSESERRHPFGPSLEKAKRAFRQEMPQLVGHENICDFIACIAQGLLLGAISELQSSRLLYAAQVAQGALRCRHSRNPSA